MSTLFDLTRKLSEKLQHTVEGTADSGTTTTLVDAERTEGEAAFLYGTLWLTSGDNSGVSRVVSAWTHGTDTMGFDALSAAVAAGVTYQAAGKDFPRWLLRRAVNQAVADLLLPQMDTSLTVTADTEAYALPTGVRNICKVTVQVDDNAPYGWQLNQHWEETDGYLRFDEGFEPSEAGRTIRLFYNAAESALTADASALDDRLEDEVVLWKAAVHALRWKIQRHEGDADWYAQMLNEALANEQVYLGRRRAKPMGKVPRLSGW